MPSAQTHLKLIHVQQAAHNISPYLPVHERETWVKKKKNNNHTHIHTHTKTSWTIDLMKTFSLCLMLSHLYPDFFCFFSFCPLLFSPLFLSFSVTLLPCVIVSMWASMEWLFSHCCLLLWPWRMERECNPLGHFCCSILSKLPHFILAPGWWRAIGTLFTVLCFHS